MIVEFCRWGHSLAVRIPKAVADALNVSHGKRAEIRVENGALVLRPFSSRDVSRVTRSMNCCAE
jgi:antitoxin component of MazEF toxin-antitoxin module